VGDVWEQRKDAEKILKMPCNVKVCDRADIDIRRKTIFAVI